MDRATRRPESRGSTAHPGQIIVMFALFSTAMFGVLGLATDLGFAFAQRRTVQNAADAGALAGARAVAKSLPGKALVAGPEVSGIVAANRMGSTPPEVEACRYVDDGGTDLGDCDAPAPPAATGVRVTVRETHPTFFIRVVPGAPEAVTVRATATAHVQLFAPPRDGPFIVCGVNTALAAGGNLDILVRSGSGWAPNPAADGKVFKIHGPQIEKCKATAARFMGLADGAANRGKTPPAWLRYTEGNAAGSINADVPGVQGCQAGRVVTDCVAFLPVAVDDPAEAGNNRELWVPTVLPFYITRPKANEHEGTLLLDYLVVGRSGWGWRQGVAPAVVRLTE